MPTVINNPGPNEPREDNWATSLIVGIVVIILVILFFIYGLPLMRGTNDTQDINIEVPTPDVDADLPDRTPGNQ